MPSRSCTWYGRSGFWFAPFSRVMCVRRMCYMCSRGQGFGGEPSVPLSGSVGRLRHRADGNNDDDTRKHQCPWAFVGALLQKYMYNMGKYIDRRGWVNLRSAVGGDTKRCLTSDSSRLSRFMTERFDDTCGEKGSESEAFQDTEAAPNNVSADQRFNGR